MCFSLQIHFIQDSNGVGDIVYLFDYITGDSVGVSAVTLHIFRPIMILVFKIHLGAWVSCHMPIKLRVLLYVKYWMGIILKNTFGVESKIKKKTDKVVGHKSDDNFNNSKSHQILKILFVENSMKDLSKELSPLF